MDGRTLADAMGRTLPQVTYDRLAGPFTDALIVARCTTVDRVAMWSAQIGHESAGLRYMEEIASGAAYEGRKDLGNVQPGDGPRYKGRGPIQLTGRANYSAFSRWCHAAGLVDSPDYLVRTPTLVALPRWGFLAAAWYWTVARPKLNAYADVGDVEAATRAVNGGINGLADRAHRWRVARALGARLLAPTTPGDDMAQVPQEQWAKVYRQETAALDYRAHHGQPTDDQLGHVLSTRLELNRRLDQVLAALVELTARVAKIEGTK